MLNSRGELAYFTLCANDLTRTIATSHEHEGLIDALLRSTAVIEFNLSGEVLKETLGTRKRTILSPSLASFLDQLEPVL